jgi:hypothetical protein
MRIAEWLRYETANVKFGTSRLDQIFDADIHFSSDLRSRFLYHVSSFVSFGVRPMRGNVRCDGVDFIVDVTVHAVHLFREHLMPFRDQLQLVLKIFGQNADL